MLILGKTNKKSAFSDTEIRSTLDLSGITARDDSGTVISDFSFTVNQGEVRALIGTDARDLLSFVHLFSGELLPERGSAHLGSIPLTLNRHSKYVEVIHQGIHVYPMMPAWEQIMLDQSRSFVINPKKQIRTCNDAAARFGIHMKMTQPAHQLSDENKKLLSFLRAYINRRPVLIIHEPFHDINQHGRNAIRRIISAMKENGQAIIVLTSYLEDALMVSDSISVVSKGHVILTQDARAVTHDPKEVMYELSGWKSLENERKTKDNDLIQSIIDATDIISSSSELNQILQYLADDIGKVLNADQTLIYIIDHTTLSIVDLVSDSETGTSARDFPPSFLECLPDISTVLDLQNDPADPHPLFSADRSARSLTVMPIRRNQNIEGGIISFYHYAHTMNETDERYLLTFSKEIRIAIETSRLLGRSMLLQESHHRIKNNLQMIMSMIYMQKAQYKEQGGNVEEILDSITSKISSIAIVHNLMAKDDSAASIINLKRVVQEIVALNEQSGVRIEMDLQDISIPYNKVTLISLVINELICNSLKYAFEGREDNVIRICCHNDGKQIHLDVADNGKGFPADTTIQPGGLGLSIVDNIIRSMKGTLTVDGSDGCHVSIVLPLSHVYDASNSA